jgi:UDP-N-acetylmuramoylalanine--D-glutamate ligase
MKVPWTQSEWKRVVVYGLGASGMAATRFLRSRGVEVLAIDRKSAEQLDLSDLGEDNGVEWILGEELEELPPGIDGVVVSPGVPPDRPLVLAARRAGLPLVAEVELAYPFLDGDVIGITGSNGKSTTTLMTGELLKANGMAVEICGNIGVPLSSRIDGAPRRTFVTELSSFQLDSVDTFHPRAAALLNLSADHLDWHGDAKSYFAAKKNLFRNQNPSDIAVLNADDEAVSNVAVEARRRFFSSRAAVQDGCYLDGDIVVEVDPESGRQPLFKRTDVSLPGPHNLENAMAAALLSLAVGANPELIPETLARFRGLPHRLELVLERRGVAWYDDSKATNFAATARSLDGFDSGSVHLILGGRNKGGDPAELAEVVARKVRRIYLVGEAATEIEPVLGGVVEVVMAGTLQSAVDSAQRGVERGETVLLSPACASFDQYRNFAERGRHFQDLVRNLNG